MADESTRKAKPKALAQEIGLPEDLPPLEDLSEVLKKACKNRSAPPLVESPKTVAEPTQYLEVHSDADAERFKSVEKLMNIDDSWLPPCARSLNPPYPHHCANDKPAEKDECSPQKQTSFCGFSRGFLSGKASSQGDKATATVVKPKSTSERHVLPEVQEAMRGQQPEFRSKEWITDDLLAKIQSNPQLAKQLEDPRFGKALASFQTDPKLAYEMLKNDAELSDFVAQFSALMGEHFTSMAPPSTTKSVPGSSGSSRTPCAVDSSPKGSASKFDLGRPVAKVSAEEQRIQSILSDAEISGLLQDQQIQDIILTLKRNPREGHRILHDADGALKVKIQKLVEVGLLGIATT